VLDADAFVVMADAAPVMIWTAGSDAQCTFLNKLWLEFTGRPLAKQLGDGWIESVHIEDRGPCLERYLAAFHAREPFELECRVRRADGVFRWILGRGAPRYDIGGRFAGYIGSCLDVTELKESERQMRQLAASLESAREHERTNVARELHDDLGQTLTALKLEVSRTVKELMQQGIQRDSIDRLQSLVGGIELAHETVRRIATSLRPPALDHLGLVAAIELEAAALARRTGIRCRVIGNRRVPTLHPAQTTAVFRIVQEALTNVLRHASASAIGVRIDGSSRSISVEIRDNGRGIVDEPVGNRTAAIGLLGMRERAEMIGATLSIRSRKGKGTVVSLSLARSPIKKKRRR